MDLLAAIPQSSSQGGAYRLDLISVIGVSAVSFASSSSRYAYLAGSLAILNTIQEDGSLHQTFHGPLRPEFPHRSSDRDPQTPTKVVQATPSHVARHFGFETESVSEQFSPRQRTRSASCVAISADGRWLAVGENGFAPRILVYSLAQTGQESPMYILREHEIGIRCLAISPDGKWLCSVGDLHDGNIFVWELNPKKSGRPQVRAANKCTADVRSISFLGNKVITVGLRHIKLWSHELNDTTVSKVLSKTTGDTPSHDGRNNILPVTLSGRNCLLGDLIDPCFHQVSAIDSERALVCTKSGELFMITGAGETSCVLSEPIPLPGLISCFTYAQSSDSIFAAMRDGLLYKIDYGSRTLPADDVGTRMPSFEKLGSIGQSLAVSVACVQQKVLVLDSDRNFHSFQMPLKEPSPSIDNHVLTAIASSSHSSPIVGITDLQLDHIETPGFVTWTGSGRVLVWDYKGRQILGLTVTDNSRLSRQEEDELRLVKLNFRGKTIYCGYKSGYISQHSLDDNVNLSVEKSELLLDAKTQLRCLKAHETALTTILTFDFKIRTLVATGGRDRMLQLYTSGLELIQTCDFHNGAITNLLFLDSKSLLASSSTDRSLILSKISDAGAGDVLVSQYRIFSFKYTPLSMTLSNASADRPVILVSVADKSLYVCDAEEKSTSLRLTDHESGESVTLTHMVDAADAALIGSEKLLLGINSVDKSVRIHDTTTGATISKAYGHSEGIVGIVLMRNVMPESQLIAATAGLDGVIMIWNISLADSKRETTLDNLAEAGAVLTPPSSKPLRRILSRPLLRDLNKPHSFSARLDNGIRNRSPVRAPNYSPAATVPESPLMVASARQGSRVLENSVQPQPNSWRLSRQQARSVGNLRRDDGPTDIELISYLRRYQRKLGSANAEAGSGTPELLLELRSLLDRLER